MPNHDTTLAPGRWTHGALPSHVVLGADTVVTGELAFKRFHSTVERALVIGAHGTMDRACISISGSKE